MPSYKVIDNLTGQSLVLDRPAPPTEDELASLFSPRPSPLLAQLQPPPPSEQEYPNESNLEYGLKIPLRAVGEGVATAGRIGRALIGDVAAGMRSLVTGPREASEFSGNIPASFKGEPLPIDAAVEQSAAEQKDRGEFPLATLAAKGALGVAETMPKVYAGAALGGSSLLGQSIAMGGLFGLDKEGNFHPKEAVIASLMPGIMKVAGNVTSAGIAKAIERGAPLESKAAQNIIETLGEQSALNAYMIGVNSPELVDLYQKDPAAFREHLSEIVGQNIAFGVLGIPRLTGLKPTHTEEFLVKNRDKYADAAYKLASYRLVGREGGRAISAVADQPAAFRPVLDEPSRQQLNEAQDALDAAVRDYEANPTEANQQRVSDLGDRMFALGLSRDFSGREQEARNQTVADQIASGRTAVEEAERRRQAEAIPAEQTDEMGDIIRQGETEAQQQAVRDQRRAEAEAARERRRSRSLVVPGTAAQTREPGAAEVRRLNLKTITQILNHFPSLEGKRERAREIRDAAFPELKYGVEKTGEGFQVAGMETGTQPPEAVYGVEKTPEGYRILGEQPAEQPAPAAQPAKPASEPPPTTLPATMETARRIADMSPDELYQQANSFNTINLEIGRNATEADVAELKKLLKKAESRREESTANVKLAEENLSKSPDDAELKSEYEAALNAQAHLSSMPQFFREAIAEYEKTHPTKKESNASTIPSNQAQPGSAGNATEEGQGNSSQNVEQAASQKPESVAAREKEEAPQQPVASQVTPPPIPPRPPPVPPPPIPSTPAPTPTPERGRAQVGGVEEIGQEKDVEKVAEIQAAIKSDVFDPSSPDADQVARDISFQLTDPKSKGSIGQELKNRIGGQDMALALLRGNLIEHAIRMEAKGDPSLINFLLEHSEDFALIVDVGGGTTSGRVLRGQLDLSQSPLWEIRNRLIEERNKAAAQGLRLDGPELSKLLSSMSKVDVDAAELTKLLNAVRLPSGETLQDAVSVARPKDETVIEGQEAEKVISATEKTAKRILDKLERSQTEVLLPDKVNIVRAIIREHVRLSLRPNSGERPISLTEQLFVQPLADKLIAVDVKPETANQLAREVFLEASNKWSAARVRTMNRIADKGSIGSLIEQIRESPWRAQHDQAWRLHTAENWFMENGLALDQAREAAKLFNAQFEEAMKRAGARVAERILKGKSPQYVSDLQEAIRADLLNPNGNWIDRFAEKTGWKKPTPEQYKRLAELEQQLTDESLSPQERSSVGNRMMDIVRLLGKRDGSFMRAAAESLAGSLLSGVRTLTVQMAPSIMTLRDFTIMSLSDPKNAINFATAIYNSMRRNMVQEAKYSWKNNAYSYHLGEMDLQHSELHRVWDQAEKEFKTGNPAQKAFARLKQLYALHMFVFKILNTVDNTQMSVANEWKLAYYGSLAMKEAGLKNNDISDLVDTMTQAHQAAYDKAVESGLDHDTASVRANNSVTIAAREWIASKTGDERLANSAAKSAENDVYSMVGRRGPDVKRETDEGMLSNLGPNQFIEWVSQMRGKSGAGHLGMTALFGFVNIPFRTAKSFANFGPYGLLRYGIDSVRRRQGKDTLWKQSYGNALQRRARLREAVAGTIVTAIASAWAGFHQSSDDDAGNEKFALYITGSGPKSRPLRDAWDKRGFKPYSLNFVIDGRIVNIPLTRVGESMMFPFIIPAAVDDAQWRKKELAASGRPQPGNVDLMTAALVGEYFKMSGQRGIFQTGTQIARLMEGGDSIEKAAAKLGAGTGSALAIPMKQLLASVSDMLVGPLDASSASSIIANQMPLIGLPAQYPAINRFGDQMYDRSWYGRITRLGLPIAFQVDQSPENERLYPTLVEKGVAPPDLRRSYVEDRYGDLTNDQFYRLAKRSGELLKDETVRNLQFINSMNQVDAKSWLREASDNANEKAATEIGLQSASSSRSRRTQRQAPSSRIPTLADKLRRKRSRKTSSRSLFVGGRTKRRGGDYQIQLPSYSPAP